MISKKNNNQVDMIDNKTALKHGEIFIEYLTKTFPGCNPLAPGFMKEWKLSILLGHEVETEKHKCDAWDSEGNQIEYLSCLENNIEKKRKRDFAIDCMFSSPPDFKKKSLKRISRNKEIYYAIFKEGSLDVLECWLGCPKDLEKKIDVNLTKRDKPNKNEHTVSISKKWVRENCKRVI